MWLKLLVLFVAAASFIAADDPRALYERIDAGETIEIFPFADPDDGISYRLPNNTVPLTYDIWISTDIHRGEFAFDGRVRIRFEVIDDTTEITLHSNMLEIFTVTLFNANNQLIEEIAEFELDQSLEFLIIRPTQGLVIDLQYSVEVTYSGTIRSGGLGFYRSSYINPETGDLVWLGTTQFQATQARSAFPCYDEPGRRSLFTVAIRHDASYIALSNMPEVSRVAEPGTDYVLTSFDQTLSMQSYLVAFTISDFLFVADDDVVPPQRIYGKPHSILNGEGNMGLQASIEMMTTFETYLGIPYSFPKMDQFACPAFNFAAMENWGLAIYGEPFLLFDEAVDRTRDRENVVVVISHEFAHMWFGNLVSPAFWQYLWINEGFAILYEFVIPHMTYPDQRYMDSFFVNYLRVSLELDANPNARAMTHYVESPNNIMSLFDFVAYNKAGSVLYMMQHALTDPTWVKGVNSYLVARSYNSTNSAQFYEGIQAAADEDIPVGTPDIAAIMGTWELQAGFPLITVERNQNQLIFSQERFFYDNQESESLWSVPINYVTASYSNFEDTTPDFWLQERNAVFQFDNAPKPMADGDWMVVNVQQSGYYRVNYDSYLWYLIVLQLNGPEDAFEQIHVLNRAQLVDDAFHLARAGRITYDQMMEVMNYLNRETDHVPWALANRASTLLNRWLNGSPAYAEYQAWVRRNTRALYEKLGVNIIENELRVDRYARAIAIDLACQAGSTQCLTETAEILDNMLSTGEPIAADLVQTIYCNGVRGADASLLAAMQNELFNTTLQRNRNFIIAGLGCIADSTVLHSHMFSAIQQELALSTTERSNILNSPLNHGESSLRTMIEFIRFNYGGINLINPNQVAILCNNIAQRVSSEAMFAEFSAFLGHLQVNGAITTALRDNLRITSREIIDWQNRHLYYFMRFFGRHPPEGFVQ